MRKAILEEFDPVPKQKIRTVQDYQKEILQLLEEHPNRLEFHQILRVIGKFLRGWQMAVPEGHTLGVNARSLLEGVHQQIEDKL